MEVSQRVRKYLRERQVSHNVWKFWLSCAVVLGATALSIYIHKSIPEETHAVSGIYTDYLMNTLIGLTSMSTLCLINPYDRFNKIMCVILLLSVFGNISGGFLFHYSSSNMVGGYITNYRNLIMASQILLMLRTIYKNDLITGTWASIVDTFRRSGGAVGFKIQHPLEERQK